MAGSRGMLKLQTAGAREKDVCEYKNQNEVVAPDGRGHRTIFDDR